MNLFLGIDFGIVILGLIALWFAGDLVVRYAIEVAEAFNVSTFFLGFIVLAIAADIPELGIALVSAFNGVSEIAVGDIVGANFCDMALVIGSTLMFAGSKVQVSKTDSKKLMGMLVLTAFIMAIVFSLGSLNHWHGLALMLTYVCAIIWLWKKRDTDDFLHEEVALIKEGVDGTKDVVLTSKTGLIIKLLASGGLVMVASGITVHFAMILATKMLVAPETIGAVVLGVGTSLPELALSLGALRRGEYALALGPTLGTVLEQTTLILGILAFFSDKPVRLAGLEWACWFMFAAFAIIAYGLMRPKYMGRSTGAVLISLFFGYLAYQVCIGV